MNEHEWVNLVFQAGAGIGMALASVAYGWSKFRPPNGAEQSLNRSAEAMMGAIKALAEQTAEHDRRESGRFERVGVALANHDEHGREWVRDLGASIQRIEVVVSRRPSVDG